MRWALGHPITKAYDIAEGWRDSSTKPVQHAYRKITDTASAFSIIHGDMTLI
jgi:hypothetical protein